jgi:3-(3-hydroxy-phenyl)propionate hydroxylase
MMNDARPESRKPMRDTQSTKVLVVGAGPIGLLTTALLIEEGIPVVLIESCSELPHDLRASTFHPPTLDLLERLGVVDS